MSLQRRQVSVPGSLLITWFWHVESRDEWSKKMTSSHITCISLRFLVARGWFRASPQASTRGQFTKCHNHLMLQGIVGMRMLFSPPSNYPSLLIKSHCQPDVIWGEVLVTLWVLVQPTVPRIHPSRAFFVLVCHTAAMSCVCKGHNIPVYLCLSGWLKTVQANLWIRACIYQTSQMKFPLKKSQLQLRWKWGNKTHSSCNLLLHEAKCSSQAIAWFITCMLRAGIANQRREFTQNLPPRRTIYILLSYLVTCKRNESFFLKFS